MKKMFWLTQLALTCCYVSVAQQVSEASDSTAGSQHIAGHGNNSPFVNFSGSVKEFNRVWLEWDVDSAEEGDYFVVERSTDGIQYETIDALRNTDRNNHYELTDMAPPNGTDFYRIKYTTARDSKELYSKTIQLSLSGEVDFKFYPNPVDKLFIIRTEHMIDMQVIDAVGVVRLSKRLQPGIQVINISSLERGVYILRVADKESNRIVSNQLIKN